MARKQITPVLDILPEETRVTFAMQWVQLNGKQREFLLRYVEKGGSIREAARLCGVTVHMHHSWMETQEHYREVFNVYQVRAVQQLEDEAKRRAFEGVDEPIYFQGVECGTVRKYSDTLLMFLLKGAAPEKYRERTSMEHTGPNGGPITVATLDLIVNG